MLTPVRPLEAQKGVPKVAISEKASPISVFILVSTVLVKLIRWWPCLWLIQIFSITDRLLAEMQWACQLTG